MLQTLARRKICNSYSFENFDEEVFKSLDLARFWHVIHNNIIIIGRVHATLQPALSVDPSVKLDFFKNLLTFTGSYCLTAPAPMHG